MMKARCANTAPSCFSQDQETASFRTPMTDARLTYCAPTALERALDPKNPVRAVFLGRAEIAILALAETRRCLIPAIAPVGDVAALHVEGGVARQPPAQRQIEFGDLAGVAAVGAALRLV